MNPIGKKMQEKNGFLAKSVYLSIVIKCGSCIFYNSNKNTFETHFLKKTIEFLLEKMYNIPIICKG